MHTPQKHETGACFGLQMVTSRTWAGRGPSGLGTVQRPSPRTHPVLTVSTGQRPRVRTRLPPLCSHATPPSQTEHVPDPPKAHSPRFGQPAQEGRGREETV